jgi:hypothetical protein
MITDNTDTLDAETLIYTMNLVSRVVNSLKITV